MEAFGNFLSVVGVVLLVVFLVSLASQEVTYGDKKYKLPRMELFIAWLVVSFLGGVFLSAAAPTASSTDTKSTNTVAQEEKKVEEQIPAPEPAAQTKQWKVEVENQIVKNVDGKNRYFFYFKNADTENFEGSVSIVLVDVKGRKLGSETFSTTQPIEPDLGRVVYFDINTGPVHIYPTDAEVGIEKFTYLVTKDGKELAKGEGQITNKYEGQPKY